MAATQTLTCACGASVQREMLDNERYQRILDQIPAVCDACIAREEEQESERERLQQECEHAKRVRARRRACGIPESLHRTWEEVTAGARADVIATARYWAAGDIKGLFLGGPVGVGKTWIAGAAAWARLEHGPVRWFSAPVLLAHLGLKFDDELHLIALRAISDEVTSALVLDDIDKVRPTEYGAERLFLAVDGRVQANKPLLVTSNLDLEALARRYPEPHGEAIASRLAQYCQLFTLEGEDRRLARFAA